MPLYIFCKLQYNVRILQADEIQVITEKISAFFKEVCMKLIIIRHGDPDYTIDSLTSKGWKEVDYLSEKLAKLDVKTFYVSPLGRAKDTASLTLKKMNGRQMLQPQASPNKPPYISRRYMCL